MHGVAPYPLYWPLTQPRTQYRRSAAFQVDFSTARDHLINQIGRLGGREVLLTREEMFPEKLAGFYRTWPLPNVWQGVSVENRHCLSRVADLRAIPAAVRFLSLEPLLEDLGDLDLSGIHWVIVGGESGPGARTMDPAWARKVRDQCEAASVPFFFKQWGGFLKKKTGRLLDGRTHDDMPARMTMGVP